MDIFFLDKLIYGLIIGLTAKGFFLLSLGGMFLTYGILGVDSNSKRSTKK